MKPGEAHGMGSEAKRRGRSLVLAAKQTEHQGDRPDGCWMLCGKRKRAPIAASEGGPDGREGARYRLASDQANGAVGTVLLLTLIRLLSLRLALNAAAAPRRGTGPGTASGTRVNVATPLVEVPVRHAKLSPNSSKHPTGVSSATPGNPTNRFWENFRRIAFGKGVSTNLKAKKSALVITPCGETSKPSLAAVSSTRYKPTVN